MNGLVGSSLYDTLNKMLIGFLILGPFLLYSALINNTVEQNALYLMLSSWFTGILYWALYNSLLSPILLRISSRFFGSFDNTMANEEYKAIQHTTSQRYVHLVDDKISCTEYLKAYYRVQKKGLLGNVPILEGYSEFFKNFIVISIEWIVLLIGFLLTYCSCNKCNILSESTTSIDCNNSRIFLISLLGLFIILDFIFISARKHTERKIFSLIIKADLLGELAPDSKIKKNR